MKNYVHISSSGCFFAYSSLSVQLYYFVQGSMRTVVRNQDLFGHILRVNCFEFIQDLKLSTKDLSFKSCNLGYLDRDYPFALRWWLQYFTSETSEWEAKNESGASHANRSERMGCGLYFSIPAALSASDVKQCCR